MSVIVKNMEMPKNCAECRFWSICECLKDYEDYVSVLEVVDDGDLVRDSDCPLIEIPTPHGRLIDADELVRIWTGAKFYGNIKPIVDARPTVIEAEGETDGR